MDHKYLAIAECGIVILIIIGIILIFVVPVFKRRKRRKIMILPRN